MALHGISADKAAASHNALAQGWRIPGLPEEKTSVFPIRLLKRAGVKVGCLRHQVFALHITFMGPFRGLHCFPKTNQNRTF